MGDDECSVYVHGLANFIHLVASFREFVVCRRCSKLLGGRSRISGILFPIIVQAFRQLFLFVITFDGSASALDCWCSSVH